MPPWLRSRGDARESSLPPRGERPANLTNARAEQSFGPLMLRAVRLRASIAPERLKLELPVTLRFLLVLRGRSYIRRNFARE